MRLALTPHPDTPDRAARSIEVELSRSGGLLHLAFELQGDVARLRVPAPAVPRRRDGLWRSTCFEAFVRPDEGPGYFELNLSPSSEWAAFAFDGYREGMRQLEPFADPEIEVRQDDERLALRASIDIGAAAPLASALPWRIGLSAVIEGDSGAISYWALAHPDGPPDFHHQHCFALQLPAARTP